MLYKIVESDAGAVKSVKTRMIEATGILFGSPDQKDSDGDFFHTDTETGMVNGAQRPFMIQHGWSSVYGKNKLADAIFEQNGDGWIYSATFLDTPLGNQAFAEVTSRPYRSSSGAAGHTVTTTRVKNANQIETWMVAEISGTQTPADPNNPYIQQKTKSDYMAQAIYEMFDGNKIFLTDLVNQSKEFQKSLIEQINSVLRGENASREALAQKLLDLKNGFTSGEKFQITDEWKSSFDADFEDVVKPIELIKLQLN
jgi:hypothetical protein